MNYEKYLSQRVKEVPPSGIRKFFDLAQQMEGVVSLGVGEPDFKTPWHICEEAIHSIKTGKTYYTASTGIPELRREICKYYQRRFSIKYNYENECMVTVGASEGIDLVMRSFINPGDEVIILQPGYVAYEPSILLAGGKPVIIELKEENQFKLTLKQLQDAITDKTKMLFVNFPSNPTGGVMTYDDYKPLIEVILKHDLLVFSDEIYAELSYNQKPCSIAQFDEIKNQVIVLNGFSKAYSMTGWRLGYVLANPIFIQAMSDIHEYSVMCASTLAQYAGVAALKRGDNDCAYHRESFEQRRNFIVNGLNRMGLACPLPEGAFYVFPNIQSTGLSSEEFCERLLLEEKVAVVPGVAFGKCGEGYIRISYAYSIEEIKEALKRIEKFLKKLKES